MLFRILKEDMINKVFISKSSEKTNNNECVEVNLTNAVYNEHLSDGYDESGRQIAILLTYRQVHYDDIKETIIELPKSVNDVNFSNCFLRHPGGYETYVSPCTLDSNNKGILTCQDYSYIVSIQKIAYKIKLIILN